MAFRPRSPLLIASCAFLAAIAAAQTVPPAKLRPVELPLSEGVAHRLGSRMPLRVTEKTIDKNFPWIEVELTVGPEGNVLSAKPLRGKVGLFGAAVGLARTWHYRPYLRDGRAIAVKYREFVPVLPPEKLPTTHVALPAVRDWNSFRVTLQRLGCTAPCTSYTVEVSGDGAVLFTGGIGVAVPGRHEAQITRDAVAQLFELFRAADFLSLDDEYRLTSTDLPTIILNLSYDEVHKSVTDYAGEEVGMPQAVRDLEQAVDEIARDEMWVSGNAQTVPALIAEHWDFKAEDAEHQGLLYSLAKHGDAASVRALLAAGASPAARDTHAHVSYGEMALAAASQRGDLEMTRLLLEAGAVKRHSFYLDSSLVRAIEAKDLEIVHLLLTHGADPNYKSGFGVAVGGILMSGGMIGAFSYDFHATLLMRAAIRGNPEMVAEFLRARVDVNAHDNRGRTALMLAVPEYSRDDDAKDDRAAIIRLLLAAGANVNSRDKDGNTALMLADYNPGATRALLAAHPEVNARNNAGETALMRCYDPDVARLLLAAGADPRLRDKRNRTAAEAARDRGAMDVVALLENNTADSSH